MPAFSVARSEAAPYSPLLIQTVRSWSSVRWKDRERTRGARRMTEPGVAVVAAMLNGAICEQPKGGFKF